MEESVMFQGFHQHCVEVKIRGCKIVVRQDGMIEYLYVRQADTGRWVAVASAYR